MEDPCIIQGCPYCASVVPEEGLKDSTSLPVNEGMSRRSTKQSGADVDVFTGWRKVLCYTQRAGVTKSVKRKYNRRDRREVREVLKKEAQSG